MATVTFIDGPLRRHYCVPGMNPQYEEKEHPPRMECDRSSSDVESSLGFDDLHYPVLDIDFPCTLKESETKGHFHLKIDKGIPWDKYERMLAAMADAGVIEQGYYNASVEREATFIAVRPWKQRLRRSKEVNPTKKIGSIGSAAKTGLFFPRNFDDF